jgi:PKD repeat protein
MIMAGFGRRRIAAAMVLVTAAVVAPLAGPLPPATAATDITFVGVAHSDPASQKFKAAVLPVTAQAGDTAVMVFTRASTVTWTGPTGVTGWTQIDSFGNGSLTSTLYRKTLVTGDLGATVRFDTANFAKGLLSVSVYRGVDPGSPFVTARSSDNTATTTHTTPTVAGVFGQAVMSYWVDRSDTTTGWTTPAPAVTRDTVIGTGTGRYSGLSADSGGVISTATYGGLVGTSTPSTRAMMWTIAMPPAQSAGNQPPVAAFSNTCTALDCDFDSTQSADPEHAQLTYAWDFDDGAHSTAANPSHTFPSAGTYDVHLTVTDDVQNSDSVTHQVTVDDGTTPANISFVGVGHSDPQSQKFKQVTIAAGAQAGDVALMEFTRASTVAWTGPSQVTGWTQVDSFTASSLTSTIWTKTLTGADLGQMVRFDTANFAKALLTVTIYRGVDTAAAVTAAHASDTSRTAHVSPSIVAADGDWVVSSWVDRSSTTTGWSAPPAMTSRDVVLSDLSGRYSGLIADSGGPVPAGTYSGKTATSTPETVALMWTVKLPAGEGGPPPPGDVTKLLVIMEENRTTSVFDLMPYFKSLSNTYGKATAFSGLVHPSEGNYIAIASGQGANTCGLTNPLPGACAQPGGTVYGQALTAGKAAKIYAESMTSNCQKTNNTLYAVRHNPWPYFPAEASSCSALDVPLGTTTGGALASDIDTGALPNASMVVPNLQNDLHDGTPDQADAWLQLWMPRLMSGPDYQAGRLAIVITFDEGIGANQNVPFVVVHPTLNNAVVTQPFDHYALTRMYDDVLGVPPLNAAATHPGLKDAFGL